MNRSRHLNSNEIRIAENLAKQIIESIPGSKIITVAADGFEPQAFDVSAKGKVGYDPSHYVLFVHLIAVSIKQKGGLIIRQFLSLETERVINGKRVMIPKKNIYGIALGKGKIEMLSSADVKDACTYDCETGAPIAAEADCYYKDFPVPTNREHSTGPKL